MFQKISSGEHFSLNSKPKPTFRIGSNKANGNAAGWISQCSKCGDWIITRHRRKSLCLDCISFNLKMGVSKIKNFYRSSQWKKLRQVVFSLKGHFCLYCGEFADCIDHFIPISRGGTNNISNLCPCCRRCNSKKSGKLLSTGGHRMESSNEQIAPILNPFNINSL